MRKALSLGADAVIFDLEDAVAIDEKEHVRGTVAELVDGGGRRLPLFVRVNPTRTPWFVDDVFATAGPELAGIVLPKWESALDIASLEPLLARAERKIGVAVGSIEVIPILETARGVLEAPAVGQCGPRIRRVAFGAYDYASDLGIELTDSGDELLVPRSLVALAARGAGAQALDTAFADFRDEPGFLADATRARGLGFSGKLCIHPSQIGPANEVFSPSARQIQFARRVVACFREAEVSGNAAITLDGRLIDYPIRAQTGGAP